MYYRLNSCIVCIHVLLCSNVFMGADQCVTEALRWPCGVKSALAARCEGLPL